MKYWLLKSEPETFSYAQLVEDKQTEWSGVRNYTARNNIKAMSKGDKALFFHTGEERQAVGVAKIVSNPQPDSTDKEKEGWVAVDIAPVEAFKKPVTLATMKTTPALKNMRIIKMSRLSVSELTQDEFEFIVKLGAK